jgi:cell fate regulator YaaT (PSP1 superfamily)
MNTHNDHIQPNGNGAHARNGTPESAENLAEQWVSPTLMGRKSNCTAGCGSNGKCGSGACGTGGGCATGGCGIASLVELIASEFVYDDPRRIIEVTYQGARKEFVEVADADLALRVQDLVIVEGERGIDAGHISMTGSLVHAKRKAKRTANEPLSKLLRKGEAQDEERYRSNLASERDAMSVCMTRIESFDLPMHLVDAEWQFDHHRITFFFTAEGRVDFRELVRDLAAIFHTRIELRQISIRDVAKRIGGVGICGKELCCTTHLGRYEHITLEHAKAQQLQANPMKLSGQCGRLKCCLLYELDNYIDALKRFPPLDGTIRTSKGTGVVQKIDIFRDLVYVYHVAIDTWETLTLGELQELSEVPAA